MPTSTIGKTTCILLRVVSIICNWWTSWVVFGGSIMVQLRSGGSCWSCLWGKLFLLVLDRSLLLGGPSTCVGIIWVAATSGCFSVGSGCLFGPCWSMFHPKSGMRPCGIRFLAVLPLLYTCSSCVATFSVMLMCLTSVMWTLCSFPLLSDTWSVLVLYICTMQ